MTQLHSLSMTRFRGVREGSIQGLTDVNLLIGRNNSGKTTVVEAIMRLAYQISNQNLDALNRSLGEIWNTPRNEQGDYPPEMWFRQDQSEPITLEGVVGSVKAWMRIKEEGNRTGIEQNHSYSQSDGNEPAEAHFLRNVMVFRPADAFNLEIERLSWPRLIANRRDKLLTRALNDIFRLDAEGFNILPESRLLVLFPEYGLPLDAQGDGTRAVMRTLMVLALLKKTLLAIEEPECHQHPGSLERFAQAICSLAREQEVQLIISTHSRECVTSFLKAAETAKSAGAVFHLTLENGRQEARRLDAEAVETLQSTGVDVRFLDLYG